MRSVNTNKNEKNFFFFSRENNALFNIQISSDGKNAMKEDTQTNSSSYAKMKRNIHTNAQTFEKQKTIDEDFFTVATKIRLD